MSSVLREYENLTKFCLNAKFSLDVTNLEELKLKECSRFFAQNAPEFTAAGFFPISRNMLMGMALIYFNFEVAIIQMENL